MKKIKKCICVIMCVCLACAHISFAEKNGESSFEWALSQCTALGILKGDENGVRADDILTRAEAVTAVIRILCLEDTANINRGQTPFDDVCAEHWASGEINTAYIRSVIREKTVRLFDPQGSVTRCEMIKMLVCALGYEKEAAESGKAYPENYLLSAKDIGLIEKTDVSDESITRAEAAFLLYNAIFVPVLNTESGQTQEMAVRFGVEGKKFDPQTHIGTTYYLSPDGNDENSGDEENPWKTLSVATKRLAAGDTLVLEDGEYFESTPVRFLNGGRKDAPITVTARNMHGAKIVFGENLRYERKIMADYDQPYVTVSYLEMTQEEISGGNTNDIFIAMYGDYNSVLYNKIHHAYEEGIKAHGSKGLRVIGNEVYDTVHESFDAVNIEDATIANNRFTDWGRVGIMIKGGSRNIKIYNNYIEVCAELKDVREPAQGIGIGGSTDNHSGLGSSVGIYEAYNYAVWNNIVYCPAKDFLGSGITFSGAKDCIAFNNVVYGAKNGMSIYYPEGIKNGWEWDPEVVNPTLYNNIFVQCSKTAYQTDDKPHNMVSDYNLFYKTKFAPAEPHSIYEDPKFMDEGKDFRLREDSPARGSGRKMENSIIGYGGENMYLDLRDYSSNERKEDWSMGAYVFGAMSAEQPVGGNTYGTLLKDGFDYSSAENWEALSGDWEVSDGKLKMTNKDSGRSMFLYKGGFNWTNYTFEADVSVTDGSDKERCSGILFRGDLEFKNVYSLRFNRNSILELCKWTDGAFASIKTWEYETVPEEIYKMKVSAEGKILKLYINGDLIDTVEDSSFFGGTVGLYAYYAPVNMDNVSVRSN